MEGRVQALSSSLSSVLISSEVELSLLIFLRIKDLIFTIARDIFEKGTKKDTTGARGTTSMNRNDIKTNTEDTKSQR